MTQDLVVGRTLAHERDGIMAKGMQTSEEEREAIVRKNVITLLERYESVPWISECLRLPVTRVEEIAFEEGRPELLPCPECGEPRGASRDGKRLMKTCGRVSCRIAAGNRHGGRVHWTRELRRHQSEVMRGRPKTPEHRRAVSEGLKRAYQNTDLRSRVSATMKEKFADPEYRAFQRCAQWCVGRGRPCECGQHDSSGSR